MNRKEMEKYTLLYIIMQLSKGEITPKYKKFLIDLAREKYRINYDEKTISELQMEHKKSMLDEKYKQNLQYDEDEFIKGKEKN